MGFGMVPPQMMTPAIVAYIAKVIVMKIGGTKIYEEMAMPFAIGMAAATGPAVILGFLHQISTTLAVM